MNKLKILKITGISLAVILILLISLPFVFKGKIVEKVKEEINNNVNAKIEFGDFSLGLIRNFPNFNLTIEDMSVDCIGEFEGVRLAMMGEVSMVVDVMSVISGDKIKLKKFTISDSKFHAIINEVGKANWDITKPSEEESKFKMSVNYYAMKNADIIYEDKTSNMVYEIVNFSQSGKGDLTQDLYKLETNSTIEAMTFKMGGIKLLSKVNCSMTADIDVDMPHSKYTFKDAIFRMNDLYINYEGFLEMPSDDITMDVKYKVQKADFKSFLSLVPAVYNNDFKDLKSTGSLQFGGHVKGVYGENKMPGFTLDLLVKNGRFQYPSLPQAVENVNVEMHMKTEGKDAFDDLIIDLNNFSMSIAGNSINAKLFLTTPISDPNINCEIKGFMNLASLGKVILLEKGESYTGTIDADISLNGKMSSIDKKKYNEFVAKGQLVLQGFNYKAKELADEVKINKAQFDFSPEALELVTLDMKIGESDLNMNGKITKYLGYVLKEDTIKGVFNFSSNLLDLNRLMGSDAKATEESSQELSAIEIPGNVDFTFNANYKKLLYDNLSIDNMKGGIVVKNKVAYLKNLEMNLLDGSVLMNGKYDSKDITKPEIDFSYSVKELDIKKTATTFNTVEKLASIASKCSGKFSTSMTFKSQLDANMKPIMNSLEGKGTLETKEVLIEGYELLNKLSEQLKMPNLSSPRLKDVKVQFEFSDGRVVVKPFDIKIGNIGAGIAGYTTFEQEINYAIKLDVPRSELGGAANKVFDGLLSSASKKGITVNALENIKTDVLVTGTVTNPKFKIDIAEQGKNILTDVKAQVKEQVAKVVEQKIEQVKAVSREEIEKRVSKLLNETEKQADNIRNEARNISNKVREEGRIQGDKIEGEASNPFAKIAAKKVADKVRSEANSKADGIDREADAKAQSILNNAKTQADRIRNE